MSAPQQNMNRITVTGLWIGDRLSPIEKLCIRSFLDHGFSFQLFVQQAVDGVPRGTVLRDATEILRTDDLRHLDWDDRRSIPYLSDLFRYRWLFTEGGWWVDMDTICLKPFTLTDGPKIGSEGRPERKNLIERFSGKRRFRGRTFANIGFLKFPAGSAMMGYCAERAKGLLNSGHAIRWGETGPALLRAALKECGDADWVIPWKTYCPVHHWNWRDLIEPAALPELRQLERDPEVKCVHLWNELWRRNGVDKEHPFSDNTFIGELLLRHQIPLARRDDASPPDAP